LISSGARTRPAHRPGPKSEELRAVPSRGRGRGLRRWLGAEAVAVVVSSVRSARGGTPGVVTRRSLLGRQQSGSAHLADAAGSALQMTGHDALREDDVPRPHRLDVVAVLRDARLPLVLSLPQ